MRRTLAVALTAASSAALAQSAPAPREEPSAEATVTAPSRARQRLTDTPRSVVSDTRAEALRSLSRDVGDRLDELPGVFVQRTTNASAAPLIRGLGGQRTLLLFDGLRLNDSLTKVGGNALLTLIDPASVRALEVVRGPASVLYGSDALGGVVLATPLDAHPEPGGDTHLYGDLTLRTATADRSMQAQGLVEGEHRGFGLLLSGAIGRTGRVDAGGDLGVQPYTGFDDRSATLRATFTPARGHRIGLAGTTAAIFDAPRPDLSSPNDRRVFRLQERHLGYARYEGDFGPVTVSARFGAMQRAEVRDRFREGRVDTEVDGVFTLHGNAQATLRTGGARVSVGVEVARDAVESRTDTTRTVMGSATSATGRGRYVGGSSYLTGGAYALWQQRLGERVLVEAGARAALVSAAAPVTATDPRLDVTLVAPVGGVGARVLLTRDVALLVNALGGFRAPNLDDYQALGSGARSFDVPNANLGPERSWLAEVGVRVVRPQWTAQAFVYGALLDGLIVRVPSSINGMTMMDGRRVFTRANASAGVLWGAELDAGYRPRTGFQASVGAGYTWAEADTPQEDGSVVREPLAKVPPAFGRASVGWRWEAAWVELLGTGMLPQTRLAASDREDVRLCPQGPATCAQVDGYVAFALRGGVRPHRLVTVAAAIENLLDTAYTPFGGGYPAPGVSANFMLRVASE
jgi:hemoglobin/transferrin/lactoferrin receptor protein